MRSVIIDRFIQHCEADPNSIFLAGDAGLGLFEKFSEQYPERFVNTGIAEQNAIGMASGLALMGMRVIAYNIIPFLLYRCYEQVRNDICYQQAPVTLLGTGAGIAYAPAGMSHYAVEDLCIARTLPNLTVFSPADDVEAELAADFAMQVNAPVYLRVAKKTEATLHANNQFDVTQPQVVAPGNDIALIFHGAISGEVLKAREALLTQGISARAISVPQVQPLNFSALVSALDGLQSIVVVEEHYLNSGLGALIAQKAAINGLTYSIKLLGISEKFIHAVRTMQGLRENYKLDAQSITQACLAHLNQPVLES